MITYLSENLVKNIYIELQSLQKLLDFGSLSSLFL